MRQSIQFDLKRCCGWAGSWEKFFPVGAFPRQHSSILKIIFLILMKRLHFGFLCIKKSASLGVNCSIDNKFVCFSSHFCRISYSKAKFKSSDSFFYVSYVKYNSFFQEKGIGTISAAHFHCNTPFVPGKTSASCLSPFFPSYFLSRFLSFLSFFFLILLSDRCIC